MSLSRLWVLFTKEVRQATSNFVVALAVIVPIIMSLLVTLVFGDLFTERARLGIVDLGDSALVEILLAKDHVDTRIYASEAALRDDLSRGRVVAGLILPADFDEGVREQRDVEVRALRWGEASFQDRLTLEAVLSEGFAEIGGWADMFTVEAEQLGEQDTRSWADRLLPVVLIYTINLAGIMVPASSMVDEKMKRTLSGLTATPATLIEVFMAKVLFGIALLVLMTLLTLLLNQALASTSLLLLGMLALISVAAAIGGVIIGALTEDMDSLMAVMKGLGFFLMIPAIVELIPQAPEWIARIFPTYYFYAPVVNVSLNGAGFADVAVDLAIVAVITGVLLFALTKVFELQKDKLATMY